MMTESDIRNLLAKAEPFRPTVELYDITEIAGPTERRADAELSVFSLDRMQIIKEQIDAFLARDPAL